MENLTVSEFADLRGVKGALIVADKGIYFQPYIADKDAFEYFGDALSIGVSGVFGALNLSRKMGEGESSSPREVARALRKEFSLQELIDKGLLSFFPWSKVTELKNRSILGVVEIKFPQNEVVRLTDPEERKLLFELISGKLKR